jgi:hypothetical protein
MVIFRVTEDEYANLKTVCSDRGARNLSDFARNELLLSIQREQPPAAEVTGHLHQIDQKLSTLESLIHRMAQILERK